MTPTLQLTYNGIPVTCEQAAAMVEGKRFEAEIINRYSELERQMEAWKTDAERYCRNEQYYRDLVVKIGVLCGDAAYTCDDGSKSEDVLCAKVPELVGEIQEELREVRENYINACRTITQMHASATGDITRGPRRGVIEDVADMKSERDAFRFALNTIVTLLPADSKASKIATYAMEGIPFTESA